MRVGGNGWFWGDRFLNLSPIHFFEGLLPSLNWGFVFGREMKSSSGLP